ncbi:hypothetical protein AVEN_75306-1 [Araneus ventricosus]|uniref:Uncharacterized protein n=1 Tax=Araneus ventricosus TaxID=182803 RepID=A0A4Y2G5K2_ARAVE|nr:hypothetical protein AVEN_75306-1 [Araneus ventricosus]
MGGKETGLRTNGTDSLLVNAQLKKRIILRTLRRDKCLTSLGIRIAIIHLKFNEFLPTAMLKQIAPSVAPLRRKNFAPGWKVYNILQLTHRVVVDDPRRSAELYQVHEPVHPKEIQSQ